MYQVAEFLLERNIRPVPVIWTFKEKGQSQCYWPKKDVLNKLKKRIHPPLVRKSQSWDILDIKLLLNGKMFDNLGSAESASEKIAANCSHNSSTSHGSGSRDSSWTTGVSSSEKSSLSSSAVKSSTEKSSTQTSCTKTSSVEKLPNLDKVLSGEKTISDKNEIANNIFKAIEIKSVKEFKDHELHLTNENNMKHFANYWLEKEEADEMKFINEMVFNTFQKEFFLNNVSFKRDEEKLSLTDSNILRCWIYVVGKKFGQKIIVEKIVASMANIQNIEGSANFTDMSTIQLLENMAAKDLKFVVIDVDLHFPIQNPSHFKMVEVLLLQESNIEIVSDNWNHICQNKVNLFVQQMIGKTFEDTFFLKHTTFKVGEKGRELLEGSNIFKLWTVTVRKKFPNQTVSEADIKKHYQTYKNTMGSRSTNLRK